MNIVQVILNQLTGGDTLGKLASAVGIGQNQADKSVKAIVPSLLAGLLGSTSRPGGSTRLSETLDQQDFGFLNNLSRFFTGEDGHTPYEGTDNPLGLLLGGTNYEQITSVLARFTGLNEGVTSKLVGFVGPIILGMLRKQTLGMDSSGVTRFLEGQKSNIASAIPTGLGAMLTSAIPTLGGILGAPSSSSTTASSYTNDRPAGTHEYANGKSYEKKSYEEETVPARGEEERDSGWGAMKWILPLVIAGLVLYFLPKAYRGEERRPSPVAQQLTEDGADTSKVVDEGTSILKESTDHFASITDEASATAALPMIAGDKAKVTDFGKLLAKLPEPAQKSVSSHLQPHVAKLREAGAKALEIPAVGPKVKSAFDDFFSEVDSVFGGPTVESPAP